MPKIDKLTSDSRFKGLNSELIKICARNVLDDIRNSETPETDINKIYNRIETEYKRFAQRLAVQSDKRNRCSDPY